MDETEGVPDHPGPLCRPGWLSAILSQLAFRGKPVRPAKEGRPVLPLPPPGSPELPPPGPVYQFLALMVVLVYGVVIELLLGILPESWQRKVNQIRFGPRWKG